MIPQTYLNVTRMLAALALLAVTIVAPGAQEATDTPDTVADESAPAVQPMVADAPSAAMTDPDQLRFNFNGAPLDAVLEYLSKAAGFVIIKTVDVEGQIDVISHQPLSRDEAVDLLNTVLNEKGYAAIRNDRTLTIVRREQARYRTIPVRRSNDPETIPSNDEMVTQIIPVRYANAKQMVADLQELLPQWATISANESSNAIIITDTQASIRRLAEIIQGLDQSISSITDVRVFALQFADAKEAATLVKEVYQNEQASSRNNNNPFQRFRRGGGGFGGFGGGGGGGDNNNNENTDSAALEAAGRVTASADERTNSLVVGAPADLMPSIVQLIESIDRSTDVLTVVEVFPLYYSDATQTAEMLTNLFASNQQTSQNQRFRERNGRGGGGGGRGGFGGFPGFGAAATDTPSSREQAASTVLAVADTRTNSVIVSAVSAIMEQVEQVIAELDKNPAKSKKVQVYSVKNANPEEVTALLQEMFGGDASTGRSTTNRNTNATTNRNTTTRTGGGAGAGGGNTNSNSGFGSTRNNNTNSR
jgi:general secretion pathway protein D